MKLWKLTKERYKDKDDVLYLLTTDKFTKEAWIRDEFDLHDHGDMNPSVYDDIAATGIITEVTSLDQVHEDHWDWLIPIADEIAQANDGDDISIREVLEEK